MRNCFNKSICTTGLGRLLCVLTAANMAAASMKLHTVEAYMSYSLNPLNAGDIGHSTG